MTDQLPLTPEILATRLGDYLVERSLVTSDQLQQALEIQQQRRNTGKNILIGQLMLELGMIDRRSLDRAVTEQIIQLRNALEESNLQLERRVEERTAELQVALKKLSELNQLKSNIIANVSHELRTPLTHIKGYLELIATEGLGPLTGDQSNALRVMQNSTERLEQLIDDLIRFSTASRGEATLRLAPVDLKFLLEDAVRRMEKKANQKNMRLQIKTSQNLPQVKADDEKITWVIVQLLDNAIKFTPSGGLIRLEAAQTGDVVQLVIADNGIGIPLDRLFEIFEPFHQLDGASTRRYGGTGLGLALVKQIVEAHESNILVESAVGQGAVFRFALPVYHDISD